MARTWGAPATASVFLEAAMRVIGIHRDIRRVVPSLDRAVGSDRLWMWGAPTTASIFLEAAMRVVGIHRDIRRAAPSPDCMMACDRLQSRGYINIPCPRASQQREDGAKSVQKNNEFHAVESRPSYW